jgi:Rod binding domain-containing protein
MAALAIPSSAAGALAGVGAQAAGQPTAPHRSARAKAKAAAQDFETVFLNSMFNEMFASLKGDGPFGGSGSTGVWRSFLAEEYAKSFAQSGGVGIGDRVYRTLLDIQEGNR